MELNLHDMRTNEAIKVIEDVSNDDESLPLP